MSRQVAGSRQRTLTWAMMPGLAAVRYRPRTGAANTWRSRPRSTLAQPRITPAAATSSGIPASVMANTAAVTVAVNAMPLQPVIGGHDDGDHRADDEDDPQRDGDGGVVRVRDRRRRAGHLSLSFMSLSPW